MDIVLKQDDPRIGRYAPDGSYEVRPTIDVEGRPFEWPPAGVRRLSSTTFVVVGTDREQHIDSIRVEGSSPARPLPTTKAMTEGAEAK